MAKRAINFSKMEVAELVQLRDEIETALNGKIVIERDELQTRLDCLGGSRWQAFKWRWSSRSRQDTGAWPPRSICEAQGSPAQGQEGSPKISRPERRDLGGTRVDPEVDDGSGEEGQEARELSHPAVMPARTEQGPNTALLRIMSLLFRFEFDFCLLELRSTR